MVYGLLIIAFRSIKHNLIALFPQFEIFHLTLIYSFWQCLSQTITTFRSYRRTDVVRTLYIHVHFVIWISANIIVTNFQQFFFLGNESNIIIFYSVFGSTNHNVYLSKKKHKKTISFANWVFYCDLAVVTLQFDLSWRRGTRYVNKCI